MIKGGKAIHVKLDNEQYCNYQWIFQEEPPSSYERGRASAATELCREKYKNKGEFLNGHEL